MYQTRVRTAGRSLSTADPGPDSPGKGGLEAASGYISLDGTGAGCLIHVHVRRITRLPSPAPALMHLIVFLRLMENGNVLSAPNAPFWEAVKALC